MSEWSDTERQASLLTPAQRRYLTDEEYREEASSSHASQLRARTRERIASGLLDLRLLLHHYPDEELARILEGDVAIPRTGSGDSSESITFDTGENADMGLIDYLSDGAGIIYRTGLLQNEEPEDDRADDKVSIAGYSVPHAYANEFFSKVVQTGIERTLADQGEFTSASVKVNLSEIYTADDIDDTPLAQVELSALRQMVEHDELSVQELAQATVFRLGLGSELDDDEL